MAATCIFFERKTIYKKSICLSFYPKKISCIYLCCFSSL